MMTNSEKVVVLGGPGVAGRATVEALTGAGYDVVSASRASGVDLLSGQDLTQAFEGASAVVDASNATNGKIARDLLTRGTSHAVEASSHVGVPHYVLLGIVGSDEVPLPYYRLKILQEQIVRAAPLPTTVLRATQFHLSRGSLTDPTAPRGRITFREWVAGR